MPDRKYPRSGRRAIIDYAGVVANSGEYVVGCFNKAVLGIARILLETRGMWPTSYATNWFNDGYDIPDDTQLATVEELISEFLEDTNRMDCTDFNNSLIAIGNAINAMASTGGCGCGSGGAGGDDDGQSGQSVDPPGTPGGTYPPGFANQAEYEAYKCDVAAWLVDSLRADILTFTVVDISALTVALIAGLLILPVPGARIAALLVAIIAFTSLGASFGTNFLAAIDNNRDALICALYEAIDAGEARSDFLTEFETAIDSETTDLVMRYSAKQIVDILINYVAVNKLFDEDEFTTFPSATCACCVLIKTNWGTTSDQITWNSEWDGTWNRIDIQFNTDAAGSATCGPEKTISWSNLTGHTPIGGAGPCWSFQLYQDGDTGCGDAHYNSETSPSGSHCIRRMIFYSTSVFSVDVSLGADC